MARTAPSISPARTSAAPRLPKKSRRRAARARRTYGGADEGENRLGHRHLIKKSPGRRTGADPWGLAGRGRPIEGRVSRRFAAEVGVLDGRAPGQDVLPGPGRRKAATRPFHGTIAMGPEARTRRTPSFPVYAAAFR